MVSAFAARQRLVLGQVKVADKSNEILAIPKLLAIEGAILTIDAMGCQREIVRTIRDGKADDLLALKGSQGSLRADVEMYAAEQKARDFADAQGSHDITVDGDHGRIETGTTTLIHDVARLQERHDGPGLQAVVMVESRREINGRTEHETRFHLTSLTLIAALMGPVVRSHWAIANSLHWVIDMMFRDDACRVRTDRTPANVTTIQHMALTLPRTAASKGAMRMRRKLAAWDDDVLAGIIARK